MWYSFIRDFSFVDGWSCYLLLKLVSGEVDVIELAIRER